MEEVYKVIQGHENYSVSYWGNVRNDITGKILKQRLKKDGYREVKLNGKHHLVHRLVAKAFLLNKWNKPLVDHKDNNTTNNKVSNLRWCSYSENNFNMSIPKNNQSGHRGVHWSERDKRWIAKIKYHNKTYYLGSFTDKEEAIKIRQSKANELFGLFTHSSERTVTLNIDIPKNTKLNINIKVKEDEELKELEEQFIKLIK